MRIRWRWLVLLGVFSVLGLCGREGYRVYRIVTPVAAAKASAAVRDPASQRRIAQGEVIGFRDAHGAHVYRALQDGGGLRMQRNAATVSRLLDRLAHDERLPELKDKCRVLYWLTLRGRAVVPQRYFDTPGIDCSRFPPKGYPWAASKDHET